MANIVDLCWGYQLAIITANTKLVQHCERIICENTNDIFNSNSFVRCNQNVLRHILQLDALLCDKSDVFEACVCWAKNACMHLAIDETDVEKTIGRMFLFDSIHYNAARCFR